MTRPQLSELEATCRLNPRVITSHLNNLPRPKHQDEPGASIMARHGFYLIISLLYFWLGFYHIDLSDILIICTEYTDFPITTTSQNKQIITGDSQNRSIMLWRVAE
jgi:hypothetical protein